MPCWRIPNSQRTFQTMNCTALMAGANTVTTPLSGRATRRATRSVWVMATVFGITSAKTRIRTVIARVAITTALPGSLVSSALVAMEEARMLTKVLPRRTAPMNRSRFASRALTFAAAREPSRSSWNIRPRETAVSAVSDAEKKAEHSIRKTIALMASARPSIVVSSPVSKRGSIARDVRLRRREFRARRRPAHPA